MQVGRGHTLAVIDQRDAAAEIMIRRQGHGAIRGRQDRRAGGRGHVDAIMLRARYAVVDALTAEDAAEPARRRPVEARKKITARCVRHSRQENLFDLPGDAGRDFRRRRHRVLWQAVYPLHIILAHRRREGLAVATAIGIPHGDNRCGGLVGAETERKPAIGQDAQRPAIQCRHRTGRGTAHRQAALFQRTGDGKTNWPFLRCCRHGGKTQRYADKPPAPDHFGTRPFSCARRVEISGLA